jgi:cytoskeleton protein RodZ
MAEDAIRDFGAFLKDARERAGIDLRTIANTTKISMPSLEALERNEVARLPGGIFLRAFVRAYAREVGLDPETTVSRFVSRFPDAAAVEELVVHEPVQERRVLGDESGAGQVWRIVGWSLPFVLVIVFFAFGGRLGWVWNLVHPAPITAVQPAEPPPPGPDAPVMSAPAASTTQALQPPLDPSASGTGATPLVGAAGDPQPAGNGGSVATPAALAVEPAAGTVRPPETITSAATEGRFRMSLSPNARCWVTVRSDGVVVFSATMQPGERQNLVLGGAVSLTVGNAAAMGLELDGKPARPLGGQGEVKTIRISAQTLKDFVGTR